MPFRGRLFISIFEVSFALALFFGTSAASPQDSGRGESGEARGTVDPSGLAAELFRERVLPLLRRRCAPCHGDDPGDLRGELDLRAREGLLRGGESGRPAVVPGRPEESPLYVAVTRRDEDLRMPPKENDRLSASEVAAIRRWIAAGAPWPEGPPREGAPEEAETADGILVETSGGLSEDWTYRRYSREDIWAFFPVERPPVPRDALSEGAARHPIDAFLAKALGEVGDAGLSPAPPADRRTLFRRAAFDLTGLPPRPEDVEAFLSDASPRAFERRVDELLASPRYGERMAQHWLDVVRYADTAGFANDWERPHAWRYRDYVIDAFNEDKPFDRFVLEQIAGDELDPEDPESLIAAGFLRMGPWEHTGMSVAAVTRQQFLDDVTQSVGVTFLGQELRCARCHDHKFDPIPTRDYYGIQAVFASTEFAEVEVPFQPWEGTSRLDEVRSRVEKLRGTEALRGERGEKNDALSRNRRKRAKYLELAARRPDPKCFTVRSGKRGETRILERGALDSPGERVEPAVLSALAEGRDPVPSSPEGRRLALARWIASPENPLTARVIVNRVWQWHFGRGIVPTPNNFGTTGGRPTHPELLDWLASRFVDKGWSVKELHRLIMTSAAYRRSSDHPEPERVRRLDPGNELLSYFAPRRLSAEEIRDGMLAVTGELSRAMGGPGVFPEINWEAALQPRHIMGAIAPAYQPSPRPEDRHRRTIYAFRIRTLGDPMLEVFNRPGSDISCERREETTVTPQVFTLFNGRFVRDRALGLALRLEREAANLGERTGLAFRLLYGRDPRREELELARRHVESMTRWHEEHEPVVVEPPRRVEREMIAEQSGELYRWEEHLALMEGFVPDPKPRDVGPETRALGELCLVLLNSNEFLYID